jgi:hypothetical protein
MRETVQQSVRCPRCGLSLFVLPQNVYPKIKESVTRAKKPIAPKKPAIARQTRPAAREDAPEPEAVATRKPAPVKTEQQPQKLKGVLSRAALRRRSIFTPFRLVMLALASVIGATGYWYWHAKAVERAEIDFASYSKSGEEAFRSHNYVAAEEDLKQACAALDILERVDPRGNSVRQLHRQALAATNLLATSILDVVERSREDLVHDEGERAKRFDASVGDGWVIVHGLAEPVTGPGGKRQLHFSYPLRVDRKPVVLVAEADAVTVPVSLNEPREMVIAAKLDSCREGGAGTDQWVVMLDSQSLFLWTDYESLVELGLADERGLPNDGMRQLLGAQAELLGVEQ